MNEPAHVRYAPGTPYGNRWPRCHEVPEGIAFAQKMVAAAANPFDAHPASECPALDLDEFGTPPLPLDSRPPDA